MDNTFGSSFRASTFGESHGGGVGVVIDGCPAGHLIDLDRVQAFLNRRRPGQSHLSTPRSEQDEIICLSGLSDNITLGTPIALYVKNKDAKQNHYSDLTDIYRPSHADYVTDAKFGIKAKSGGGRASARETVGRVAAAAIAEQILEYLIPDFSVVAYVESVKDVCSNIPTPSQLTRAEVEKTPLRCPDQQAQEVMENLIIDAKKRGDSVGGVIFCGIKNCPVGLGGPVFDKLEADLAKAMMSLPASKGFEVGSGFSSSKYTGSEHNDEFEIRNNTIRTKTNRSGGIQGGISNGEFIYTRVAFKPVATVFKEQNSVNRGGQDVVFKPKAGRHDPCVLPRAVPMVEAMAILTIMDHFLRNLAINHSQGPYSKRNI